jgi:hypothetical protein
MLFFPTIAAAITTIGLVGFVVSSLIYSSTAGDLIFNAAAVCMAAGPLIFFSYVVVGLCIEFVRVNRKSDVSIAARAPSRDPLEVRLSHIASQVWVPEGLLRERKGPLNPATGRG